MEQDSTKLEKPTGNETIPSETIHVIPSEFHGTVFRPQGALVTNPQKDLPPVTPLPPPIAPIAPLPTKVPSKKSHKMLFVIIGVIVLILIAVYFIFLNKPKVQPVITPPAPVIVCGNGLCEANETANSCSADCKPLSVCGNNQCEVDETAAACAIDCASKSVCGNNTCEVDETALSCALDCGPKSPVSGIDTDSDGLTDTEEREIYGTDATKTDTDGDTFVDLNEVVNLFDPAKFSPAPLENNPNILIWQGSLNLWSLFYPKSWTLSEDKTGVIFTSTAGDTVPVKFETKDIKETLLQWYAKNYPNVLTDDVDIDKTKDGKLLIFSVDGMSAYIDGGSTVYQINYVLGTAKKVEYRATFQMMVRSFEFK